MTNNDDLAMKLIAAAEVIATEHYTDDQWFHYLRLAHHSNILSLLAERTADKAENASLRQRVAELEELATDYGMKFQKAQDDLKKAKILFEDATMRANRADFEGYSRAVREYGALPVSVKHGEVLVSVSGFTGSGKSAIAGEIEIAMRAIGVPVTWSNGDAEKRMTGADWLTAIEMYKPTVRIVEINVPRAAMQAEPVSQNYTLPPHIYRELVNQLRDTAVKYQGCQQLREQLSATLRAVIAPANPEQGV